MYNNNSSPTIIKPLHTIYQWNIGGKKIYDCSGVNKTTASYESPQTDFDKNFKKEVEKYSNQGLSPKFLYDREIFAERRNKRFLNGAKKECSFEFFPLFNNDYLVIQTETFPSAHKSENFIELKQAVKPKRSINNGKINKAIDIYESYYSKTFPKIIAIKYYREVDQFTLQTFEIKSPLHNTFNYFFSSAVVKEEFEHYFNYYDLYLDTVTMLTMSGYQFYPINIVNDSNSLEQDEHQFRSLAEMRSPVPYRTSLGHTEMPFSAIPNELDDDSHSPPQLILALSVFISKNNTIKFIEERNKYFCITGKAAWIYDKNTDTLRSALQEIGQFIEPAIEEDVQTYGPSENLKTLCKNKQKEFEKFEEEFKNYVNTTEDNIPFLNYTRLPKCRKENDEFMKKLDKLEAEAKSFKVVSPKITNTANSSIDETITAPTVAPVFSGKQRKECCNIL